eukprot:CAMPEP_0175294466 /NCGR_PEP_ID=MMETSP0093-20121207/58010_1 /TAXON_ID=311494 /ORGANISM="Alexandrium monilatum, Strain CCMP3105" /LENGTH=72 /DNA_ID=CAMNT_0016590397 /DNA_START=32 /DNA_END=253 /DNA_ORIENTATION=-
MTFAPRVLNSSADAAATSDTSFLSQDDASARKDGKSVTLLASSCVRAPTPGTAYIIFRAGTPYSGTGGRLPV